MTLIFGMIDIPAFEILFILAILLFLGLVLIAISIFYILKELKELKNLLKKEENDIQTFERDIATLEGYEDSKKRSETDMGIADYILDSLKRGFAWEQVKSKLMSEGWSAEDLEKEYAKIAPKNTPALPVQESQQPKG